MGVEQIVSYLIATYGLPGLVILGLVYMYWKSVRRNRELEDRQMNLESEHNRTMISLVKDYAGQAKDLTAVIVKLSGCLKGIKESLARMERAREIRDAIDDSQTTKEP